MNYYSWHIADYALHTTHLTLEEDGVYRRVLDYYYDTEAPIPRKTQPVIRRLRLVSHVETFESILKEFFVLGDEGWRNLRADSVISDYNAKAEQARENGKKGGRPKKNKELQKKEKPRKTQPVNLANPEETGSKANQEPITINQEPITSSKNTTLSFDDFWIAFPKKADKKKAREIWKRRKLDKIADLIISDVVKRIDVDKKWIGGFIPNPTTYLNGDRWEDEIEPDEKKISLAERMEKYGEKSSFAKPDKNDESVISEQ